MNGLCMYAILSKNWLFLVPKRKLKGKSTIENLYLETNKKFEMERMKDKE